MTLARGPDFVCVVCRRDVSMEWNMRGRDECIPPLCLFCERDFSQGIGKPVAGSVRDRRTVMRGFALAEALRTAAAHKTWGGTFGSA